MYFPETDSPSTGYTAPRSVAQQDPSIAAWLPPQQPPSKQSAPTLYSSYDLQQLPQELPPLMYDARPYGASSYDNGLQDSPRFHDGWWARKQESEQNEIVAHMPRPDVQRYDRSPRQGSQRYAFSPTSTVLSEDELHQFGVQLEIDGDLSLMQLDWTPEEMADKRRLVQFWRSEQENRIVCGFQPIPQASLHGAVSQMYGFCIVSCIYWESQQQYCMTSVDMIRLLEFLMDIRLSMEEKNRIRRNLEGFKPVTASKNRPQTQDFFRLIMNFPNPKPRNIEKDIKVFHWGTVSTALKKIVTKYRSSVLHLEPH